MSYGSLIKLWVDKDQNKMDNAKTITPKRKGTATCSQLQQQRRSYLLQKEEAKIPIVNKRIPMLFPLENDNRSKIIEHE